MSNFDSTAHALDTLNTLALTLERGNVSGGRSIIMTPGDGILSPNASSGPGNALLLVGGDNTGGSVTDTGGDVSVSAGDANGGAGGSVLLVAGDSTAVAGGSVVITPGTGPTGVGLVTIGQDSGLQMTERAAVPGPAIGSGQGRIWLRNDTPNVLIFTDDTNVDHILIGGGDISGPASSTHNALVRWDGSTGKLVKNSNATLTDAGILTLGDDLRWSSPGHDVGQSGTRAGNVWATGAWFGGAAHEFGSSTLGSPFQVQFLSQESEVRLHLNHGIHPQWHLALTSVADGRHFVLRRRAPAGGDVDVPIHVDHGDGTVTLRNVLEVLGGADGGGDANIAGTFTATGLAYPTSDGTAGQVIQTDGSGTLSFTSVSGTISDGTTTDSTLRWSGANWVENTAVRADSAGRLGLVGQAPESGTMIKGVGERMVYASSAADLTPKLLRLGCIPYNTAQDYLAALVVQAGETTNNVRIGGGTGEAQSATEIRFYAASAVNTLTGTEHWKIDGTDGGKLSSTSDADFETGGSVTVGETLTASGNGPHLFGAGSSSPSMRLRKDGAGISEFQFIVGTTVSDNDKSIAHLTDETLRIRARTGGAWLDALVVENNGDIDVQRSLTANGLTYPADADGSVDEILTKTAAGTIGFESLADKGLPASGSTTDSTLRWSGSQWVENANVKSTAAGNLEVAGTGTFEDDVFIDGGSKGLWVGDGTGTPFILISKAATTGRGILAEWHDGPPSASTIRWQNRMGSNDNNNNIQWIRWDDTGTGLDAPMMLRHSDGDLVIRNNLVLDGTGFDGDGSINAEGNLAIGGTGTFAGSTVTIGTGGAGAVLLGNGSGFTWAVHRAGATSNVHWMDVLKGGTSSFDNREWLGRIHNTNHHFQILRYNAGTSHGVAFEISHTNSLVTITNDMYLSGTGSTGNGSLNMEGDLDVAGNAEVGGFLQLPNNSTTSLRFGGSTDAIGLSSGDLFFTINSGFRLSLTGDNLGGTLGSGNGGVVASADIVPNTNNARYVGTDARRFLGITTKGFVGGFREITVTAGITYNINRDDHWVHVDLSWLNTNDGTITLQLPAANVAGEEKCIFFHGVTETGSNKVVKFKGDGTDEMTSGQNSTANEVNRQMGGAPLDDGSNRRTGLFIFRSDGNGKWDASGPMPILTAAIIPQ